LEDDSLFNFKGEKGGKHLKVEILDKNLPNFTGMAWHVKHGEKYYIVSGTTAMFTGWEILVFPSNEKAEVVSWGEVGGGRGIDYDEAIKQIEEGELYDDE